MTDKQKSLLSTSLEAALLTDPGAPSLLKKSRVQGTFMSTTKAFWKNETEIKRCHTTSQNSTSILQCYPRICHWFYIPFFYKSMKIMLNKSGTFRLNQTYQN